jgi:asparagine synthetase B (glutamine-hydrolysing)
MMINRLISSLKTGSPTGPIGSKSRFVILGWTKTMLPPKLSKLAQENGLDYFSWGYGRYGTLFLLNSHPDIACTDEAVVVRLGFARSKSFEPLCAHDLLARQLVSPHGVDHTAIHGKPLVLWVSQRKPAFWVYQSLVSTSQIYYWRADDWTICTDTLRHLAAAIDPLELNPDAVPQHLLYRTVPGDMTYFKDVHKLLSGHLAKYREGEWRLEQVERLDDLAPERRVSKATSEAVLDFDRQAQQVVGSYVKQITGPGHEFSILLSGGVDSSLLASLAKSNMAPQQRLQSMSYAIHVPSFTDEIEYAQYAIDLLETEHTFVDVLPDDYPHLLEQSIDLLAQPIDNEQDPCYLVLAQFLSNQEPRYLLSGSAADTLLGNNDAKRLLQIEKLWHIPWASPALSFLGRSLKRVWPNKAYGMREAAHILRFLNDPLSPHFPLNRQSMFTDLEAVQKCFNPNTIRRAIEYRHALFDLYSSRRSLLEGMHLIELTHDVHEEEAAHVLFFQTYGLEVVTPYLDSDFIRFTSAFEPHIRFYANGRTKWLPKQLVENRLRSQTTQWPKRSGGFNNELFEWMKHGILKDLVWSIERPGYMSVADFEQKREEPNWFTWNLLNLDLIQKRLLRSGSAEGSGEMMLYRFYD